MHTVLMALALWCLLSAALAVSWAMYWQARERQRDRELRRLQAAWRREVERRDRDAA